MGEGGGREALYEGERIFPCSWSLCLFTHMFVLVLLPLARSTKVIGLTVEQRGGFLTLLNKATFRDLAV